MLGAGFELRETRGEGQRRVGVELEEATEAEEEEGDM